MKYGDIVVYKNQIGTVVKSENDFKFHPCNYGSCSFSLLDTITDEDIIKMENWINNLPMKVSGFKTPNEMALAA